MDVFNVAKSASFLKDSESKQPCVVHTTKGNAKHGFFLFLSQPYTIYFQLKWICYA